MIGRPVGLFHGPKIDRSCFGPLVTNFMYLLPRLSRMYDLLFRVVLSSASRFFMRYYENAQKK
jgi:hypothetical protein